MPNKRTIPRACEQCRVEFLAPHYEINRGNGRFCSRRCAVKCSKAATPVSDVWRHVAKIDDATSCWEWTGARGTHGYGQIRTIENRSRATHRLFWEMTYGPIPHGLWVLHRCDNPPCVRPDHLFLGTPQDNHRDMVSKGRVARGTMKPNVKLSPAQITEIRARYASGGLRYKDLAQQFGISICLVGFIVRREKWKHVD
jgi:hypothetical protein